MSNDKKIVRKECRFVVHCDPNDGQGNDLHVSKVLYHYEDGTTENHIELDPNFKRPFWITKEGFRNHKSKKEWEDLSKLREFKSSQKDLVKNIARALEKPWFTGSLKDICISPYVYGADILSTCLVKESYHRRYPGTITPFSIAVFDIETDVTGKFDYDVLMGTLSMKDKVITTINKKFFAGYVDVEKRLQEALVKYLDKYVQERNIKWEIQIVDNEMEVFSKIFERAHIWKPDTIAIWNIDYEIPKLMEVAKKYEVDLAELMSDPSVPANFKHFRYKKGLTKKVKENGNEAPIIPAEQWHTVFCPSSWYFLDAMCAYRQIRLSKQKESYGLDAVLEKTLNLNKLKFKEADRYIGIEWHQFMQTKYPFEYTIYNVFDCVGVELLDEKTRDLNLSLPMSAEYSDFSNFTRQPRRTADKMHFQCLKKGKAVGTTGKEMKEEFDKLTIGLKDWIVTLPAHLVVDNGLRIIQECCDLKTNIRVHLGDLDVAASYPNGESVFNISKETTHRELIDIMGVPEFIRRRQGINISCVSTNAVEMGCDLFGLPTFDQLLTEFKKEAILEPA